MNAFLFYKSTPFPFFIKMYFNILQNLIVLKLRILWYTHVYVTSFKILNSSVDCP